MADNVNIQPQGTTPIATDEVGGAHYQRVKIAVGGDGVAASVPGAGDNLPLANAVPAVPHLYDGVNTMSQRSLGAISEGGGLVGVPGVGLVLLDSAGNARRLGGAEANVDGQAGYGRMAVANGLYNGSTFERERGNTEGTLLASGARTAAATSPVQTNHNARGVIAVLDITAAGTGTIQVALRGEQGSGYYITGDGVNVSGPGTYAVVAYPGAAGPAAGNQRVIQAVSAPLPRSWSGWVFKSDASAWTFSLSYSLII